MKITATYKKFLSFSLAFVLIFSLSINGFAATADIQRPSDSIYVLDNADILSSTTENEINSKAASLFEKYSLEMFLLTVSSTGGMSTTDYCYDIYGKWNVGGDKKVGVIVLFDTEHDSYTAIAGQGIMDTLTSTKLKATLDLRLEENYAAKNYDSGAIKLFDDLYTQLDVYGATGAVEEIQVENSSGGSSVSAVVIVLIILLLLLCAVLIMLRLKAKANKNRSRMERATRTSSAAHSTARPIRTRESYYSTGRNNRNR